MKIIYAGTPEFALKPLSALLNRHQLVAVFSQPDRPAGRGKRLTASPVKQLAIEHNIPVYQPVSLRDQASLIKSLNADVMIVVAYGLLLPKDILEIPRFGCINVHASILPRWRGAAPIQRAIETGDLHTGVSIMKMEPGLDTGPVYLTFDSTISERDTTLSLQDKLADLGAEGVVAVLDQLSSGHLPVPVAQDNAQATYAKKISKQEALIDWSMEARQIHARIRAFNPWPVCHTHHRQTRIRIWQTSLVHNAGDQQPAGTVTGVDEAGITVACGVGYLRLEIMQRDGSKALPARQFCNGYTLPVGDFLSSQQAR